MKIGIDARFYGPGKGLGRYTQGVVDNLIKINNAPGGDNFFYVIFLSPENYEEFDDSKPNVKKIKISCIWYGWREQFIFPYYLWREKLDLIHFTHFNVPIFSPGKFVVTIHDLILTHFSTVRASTRSRLYYYFKNLAYRLVIWLALRRAQKVIAVSEFTKSDILAKFNILPSKIKVIYEGLSDLTNKFNSLSSKQDQSDLLLKYGISNKFLLYVGNAYPHKNLEFLLKTFSRLHSKQPDLRLVLVGKLDYFYYRLQDYARSLNLWQKDSRNNIVIFTSYIPDNQLAIFYANASAYVFPSLYEGFGLPPLEAMSYNCPVISSNSACLPEILSDACLYFNPEQEDDLMDKINKILTDQVMRDILRKNGQTLLKKYSWRECADQTLLVYKQALNIF